MKSLIVIVSAILLQACSVSPQRAPAVAAQQVASVTACNEAFVVADDAWTVEGFGGSEEQLIVSQQRPIKRCSPAVVQNRSATLDAAR